MKAMGILVAAVAGVVGFTALGARGDATQPPSDVYLTLTLQVDPVAQTWQAFGQITGNTTETSGLAMLEFDVVASGGLQMGTNGVDTTQIDLPWGSAPGLGVGFGSFRIVHPVGTLLVDVTAAQACWSYATNGTENSLLTGVGIAGQTQSGVTWGQPVLLADGTYTGSSGALTIRAQAGWDQVLPATLPAPTPAPVVIRNIFPTAINSQTVQVPNTSVVSTGIVWMGASSGSWNTTDARWSTTAAGAPFSAGWTNNLNRAAPNEASFQIGSRYYGSPTTTSPITLSVDSNIEVGRIIADGMGSSPPGLVLNSGSGVLAYGGTGSITITSDDLSPGTVVINATIADGTGPGGGVTSLICSGGLTVVLGGANTYSGSTTVAAGTLKTAATNTLPSTTDLMLQGTTVDPTDGYLRGTTLDLNGFSQKIHSVSDAGVAGAVITNTSSTPATLTLSSPDAVNTTFGGLISGKVGLSLSTAGTLALGHANSYTGTTTVTEGTLVIGVAGALPNLGAVVNDGTIVVNANTTTGSFTGTGTTIVAAGVTLRTDFTQSVLINDGVVMIDGVSQIGSISGSGSLHVAAGAGGVLTLSGPSTGTGGLTIDSGTTLVNNLTGSATGSGNVVLNGGVLGGYGTIGGAVVAGTGAHIIRPSATLAGGSAGTLTVGSLNTSGGSKLDFNLVTPNTAGGSDQIAVSGNLNISGGGTLAFTNHGIGQASLGYYRVMSYGSLTGTASNLTMPAVANNIAYVLDLNKDPGFVDVHRGFLGDANDDGTVNIVDLGTLATHYNGTGASWSQCDFNGDGVVNIVDLGILATYYNQSVGSFEVALGSYPALESASSGASSVPEPASLLLLGAGLVGVLGTRRRR